MAEITFRIFLCNNSVEILSYGLIIFYWDKGKTTFYSVDTLIYGNAVCDIVRIFRTEISYAEDSGIGIHQIIETAFSAFYDIIPSCTDVFYAE